MYELALCLTIQFSEKVKLLAARVDRRVDVKNETKKNKISTDDVMWSVHFLLRKWKYEE